MRVLTMTTKVAPYRPVSLPPLSVQAHEQEARHRYGVGYDLGFGAGCRSASRGWLVSGLCIGLIVGSALVIGAVTLGWRP